MKTVISLLTISLNAIILNAQALAGFVDYKQHFFVFDNGQKKQLEHLPVQRFYCGKNSLVWVDHAGESKIYHKGNIINGDMFEPEFLIATDHLVILYKNNILKVFESGSLQTLCINTASYTYSDSIVSYYDSRLNTLGIYYAGKIRVTEDYPAGTGSAARVGGNMAVWTLDGRNMKIFYTRSDQIIEIDNAVALRDPEENILAFADRDSRAFKVFSDGSVYEAEPWQPKWIKSFRNTLVYVDHSGTFKMIYKGEKKDILSFEPKFFDCAGDLGYFGDARGFWVIFRGKIRQLESYTPELYAAKNQTLAYQSSTGTLKVFWNGSVFPTDPKLARPADISGNTVTYYTGLDEIHFFFEGKTF